MDSSNSIYLIASLINPSQVPADTFVTHAITRQQLQHASCLALRVDCIESAHSLRPHHTDTFRFACELFTLAAIERVEVVNLAPNSNNFELVRVA